METWYFENNILYGKCLLWIPNITFPKGKLAYPQAQNQDRQTIVPLIVKYSWPGTSVNAGEGTFASTKFIPSSNLSQKISCIG